MKGLIFTSFIEMLEEKYDLELADRLLTEVQTETLGAYTVVGTYDYHELVSMFVWLSQELNVPISSLLKQFGFVLFSKLMDHYNQIVDSVNDPFEMFESIDPIIHKEVKKLYPDAETPGFKYLRKGSNTVILNYTSSRKMADVAEGLIEGCLDYYSMKAAIKRKVLQEDGSEVEFKIDFF